MAHTNPAINPPRLTSTAAPRSSHSRSPSRSPVRQQDPFIRDLSPTKTLQAFSSRPTDARNDALTKSIQNATHSQRALGTKVAQACADLRSWTRELESWHWPGTFAVSEAVEEKQRMSAMTVLSRTESMISQPDAVQGQLRDDEYWGSLPAQTVHSYERRLEQICVDFDGIDFEGLKAFVLEAHNQAGVGEASVDDSIGAIGAATDLKRLDDFTALITATILQALPYLPKLTALLETWTTRLTILRSTPKYLRDLRKVRTDLDHGWAALAVSNNDASRNANLTSESLEEMKNVISTQVYSLGKRLDRFLDMLEGRREVVPDNWIDDFEELEAEYGEWVVKAEKKVLEEEWRSMRQQVKETALKMARDDEEEREMEDTPNFGDDEDDYVATDAVGLAKMDSSRDIVDVAPWTDTKTRPKAHPKSNSFTTTTTTTTTTTVRSMTPTKPRPSISPSRKENNSPSRTTPRYVPIVVDYTHPDQPSDASRSASFDVSAQNAASNDIPLTHTRSKTPSEKANAQQTSVKQRAAFLNGDIEKSESLLKSKSAPIVRPFEHASNAFTRLFKKEHASKPAEDMRSRNVSSVETEPKRSTQQPTASVSSSQRSAVASSGSGSGKASSSFSGSAGSKQKDPRRMEYMDMVRAPIEPRPKSRETGRGREKSRTEKRSHMAYGDLVTATASGTRDTRTPRKSEDNYRPRAVSVSSGGRTRSLEGRALNPVTPWDDVPPMGSANVVTPWENVKPAKSTVVPGVAESYDPISTTTGQRSSEDARRSKSTPPQKKRTREDMTALPGQRSYEVTTTITSPSRDGPKTYKPSQLNSRDVPATYKPSGFSNATYQSAPEDEQDEFPPNWPLSASATPMTSTKPETEYFPERSASALERERTTSEGPMDSDNFEEFFVRSLPAKHGLQKAISAARVHERNFGNDLVIVRPSSAPGFRTRDMKPYPDRPVHRRPISVVEEEDYISDNETPGRDNAAAYIGKQPLKRSRSSPHVSPQSLKVVIPEAESEAVGTPLAEAEEGLVRQASITSVASHSPTEVRSIELGRRSGELAESPKTPRARAASGGEATSPMNYDGAVVFPSPPPSVPNRGSSLRSSMSSVKSESPSIVKQRLSASSPVAEEAEKDAPLNSSVPKQRKTKHRSRGSIGESVGSPDKKRSTPHSPGGDNIDRHVSEVLDRVHAPIRFKARPGSITPVAAKAAVEQRMKVRAERQGKNMTLAPAESSSSRGSEADPEVKLYHLTQVGRAEPIKLYVRLVGENERVMVRVGGGWADLADYLRQYAEHHGSRTVSESLLELQTASTPGSANGSIGSGGKRAVSGPAAAAEPKSRTPITPTIGKNANNGIGKSDPWATSTSRVAQTHQPRLWIGEDSDDEGDQSPTLGRQQPFEVPRIVDTSSRPSTADASMRPGSRLGVQDSSSPISPALDGKLKTELPEQKARWVEGMIEKAMKSASAANANTNAEKDKEKAFGDMGKVGATRRVVFRSASGAEGAK